MTFLNLRINNKVFLFSPFVFICFFLVSNTVQAIESKDDEDRFKLPKSMQIHGFLSQGFLHTSDNDLFGHSDDNISVDFRELGLNGSWRVIPELQLALQIVWRNAGQTDKSDLRVDYGVVDYNYYSSESTSLGIKAGRVPTPLGLYNDTRDVSSTRPSILLPQSIYFDRNRNLALSADGGYLYAEHQSDYGDVYFTIGIIHPRTDDPSFKHSIARDFSGEMVGDTSWVTRLNYEWNQGQIRMAVTYADFNADYDPKSGTVNLLPGKFRLNPLIFSAQYNAEKWSLTAEYSLRRVRLNDFGPFIPNLDFTGESFYVQGSYSFTPYLQGLLRYDQLIWDKTDRNGKKYAKRFKVPAHSRFAKDWTVGVRLTVIPSLLISAEYHRINGTGWLSSLENKETTQYWDLYTLMVSYDF